MAAIDEVLTEVREAGPETVTQIAMNTQLPQAVVRRALRDLEDTGLVESDRSSDRSRRARVYLPVER